jgi:hypothetical protein
VRAPRASTYAGGIPDDALRMQSNPYEAPAARVDDPALSGAEAERTAHLRHEARLRSVGVLYWLGAAATVLMVGMSLATAPSADPEGWTTVGAVVLAALLAAVIGWGYWSLSPWVRWPGTAVSVLGLLAIPIGPVIHGYFLYLLWCAKGRRVLAPGYAQVRQRTPHLRYRRTIGDWIALVVIAGVSLVLLAMLLAVGTMSRTGP